MITAQSTPRRGTHTRIISTCPFEELTENKSLKRNTEKRAQDGKEKPGQEKDLVNAQAGCRTPDPQDA